MEQLKLQGIMPGGREYPGGLGRRRVRAWPRLLLLLLLMLPLLRQRRAGDQVA